MTKSLDLVPERPPLPERPPTCLCINPDSTEREIFSAEKQALCQRLWISTEQSKRSNQIHYEILRHIESFTTPRKACNIRVEE